MGTNMSKRAFLLGIGHCPTDRHFSINPFAHNTLGMGTILKNLGYTVFHLGAEGSNVACDEDIICVTKDETISAYGEDYKELKLDLNTVDQSYTSGLYNARAIHEIKRRQRQGDIVVVMGGTLHQEVCVGLEQFRDLHPVEPACGYPNVFTRFRVFPSTAWQQYIYGQFEGNWEGMSAEDQESKGFLTTANPMDFRKPCDSVIPHYIFPEEFECSEDRDDYLLQVSRVIPSKGIEMAVKVAEATGRKLIIAGHGDFEATMGFKPPKHVELIGPINSEERKEWMSKAHAVMAWSIFPEAFCYAPVEGMVSGAVPITSQLGAFKETIDTDYGFRTWTFKETCEAVEAAGELDRQAVRQYAIDNFSVAAVTPAYGQYFERLHESLEGNDFYTK